MKHLLAPAAALVLAACTSTAEKGPLWADVVGREWSVVGDLAPATITFHADDRATGKVLNSYFVGYVRKAGAIEFGPVGATKMAGPEADMERERRFHEALAAAFRWSAANGQLQLFGEDGKVLLTFESSD